MTTRRGLFGLLAGASAVAISRCEEPAYADTVQLSLNGTTWHAYPISRGGVVTLPMELAGEYVTFRYPARVMGAKYR